MPEQALPTGRLGAEFGLPPHHVQGALRFLTAEGTLRFDAHGPYGPGYYVPAAIARYEPASDPTATGERTTS
ncbi:hypothetical protein GT352_35625 [Streptomyces sp. SID1046]|nr:hypothetical protein [Streptomyces sp. SID1046]